MLVLGLAYPLKSATDVAILGGTVVGGAGPCDLIESLCVWWPQCVPLQTRIKTVDSALPEGRGRVYYFSLCLLSQDKKVCEWQIRECKEVSGECNEGNA